MGSSIGSAGGATGATLGRPCPLPRTGALPQPLPRPPATRGAAPFGSGTSSSRILTVLPDNTMDLGLAAQLLKTCSKSTAMTFLDQNISFMVDYQFFRQIMLQKGILKIDQELTLDKSSTPIVSGFATNENAFRQSFANAMIKMASVDIVVGSAREFRKYCGSLIQQIGRVARFFRKHRL
uniref:peroxidase n=1 Tax=Nicotiana tabacum TaxID=4097 RepID=A0A1S3Z4V6_TOBAC|nr:PREDICTED: peroxidase 44-like [Nicotiana tabacum]